MAVRFHLLLAATTVMRPQFGCITEKMKEALRRRQLENHRPWRNFRSGNYIHRKTAAAAALVCSAVALRDGCRIAARVVTLKS